MIESLNLELENVNNRIKDIEMQLKNTTNPDAIKSLLDRLKKESHRKNTILFSLETERENLNRQYANSMKQFGLSVLQ